MFDVGGPEFLFLLVLALLVFGPRRLPQMGRKLGSFVGEMRRSLSDFRGHLEREVAYEEMREVAEGLQDVRRSARDAARGLVEADPGPGRSGRSAGGSGAERSAPAEGADPGERDRSSEEAASGGDGRESERTEEAEAAYRSMEGDAAEADGAEGAADGDRDRR